MALQFDGVTVGAMQYNGVTIGEAMIDGEIVYRSGPPVVTITGTSFYESLNQFRQACIDHGTTYQTVETLPFLLDTSQATDFIYMFSGCSALTSVPDFDTSQATDLRNMFQDCSSLTTAPQMDTSNVTNMAYMFRYCSALTSVPDFDTSQATDIQYMFQGCTSLTDGNVRLIGRHPNVSTTNMITDSGLTREPFYDTNGNPI